LIEPEENDVYIDGHKYVNDNLGVSIEAPSIYWDIVKGTSPVLCAITHTGNYDYTPNAILTATVHDGEDNLDTLSYSSIRTFIDSLNLKDAEIYAPTQITINGYTFGRVEANATYTYQDENNTDISHKLRFLQFITTHNNTLFAVTISHRVQETILLETDIDKIRDSIEMY